MDTDGFSAVLFDWRGTLFYDQSDRDWILASAAAIGRQLTHDQADTLAQALAAAEHHPDVRHARQQSDCSIDLHRAAALLQLRLAGFDEHLALAVWQRDGDPAATFPYPDTAPVLRALQASGYGWGSSATSTITCVRSSRTTGSPIWSARSRCRSSTAGKSLIRACLRLHWLS